MAVKNGSVFVRAYGSLNDFLQPVRRQREFCVHPGLPCPASHALEAAGIPHTEVELLLIDGAPDLLATTVSDGQRISAFPAGDLPAAGPPLRLPLPDPPVFILDVNLGKLARILRLLGLDASRPEEMGDEALAFMSAKQGRILLTRDRRLLRRRAVVHGYLVREMDPLRQAAEVMRRFSLQRWCRPFSLCSRCGGAVRRVPKREVEDRLEPLTRAHYDEFWLCDGCGRIYWAGSHLPSLTGLLERLGVRTDTGSGAGLAGRHLAP